MKQLHWRIDNEDRFKRILFDARRFLINMYEEEDTYYNKKEIKREIGELISPSVKLRKINDLFIVSAKFYQMDKRCESYIPFEITFDSKENAKGYLKELGYVSCERFTKRVEVYRLKNEKYSLVSVETYPWGKYVKTKGDIDTVKRIGRKLSFDYNDRSFDIYPDEYRKMLITRGLDPHSRILFRNKWKTS